MLTPESFLAQIQVSEDDLKAAYEARRTEFVKPERRKLDQVVVGDKAQAARDAAMASNRARLSFLTPNLFSSITSVFHAMSGRNAN